jgi:flagellar biosynthesis/type III secretory pathway ATPase
MLKIHYNCLKITRYLVYLLKATQIKSLNIYFTLTESKKHLKLATVINNNLLGRTTSARTETFDLLNDIQTKEVINTNKPPIHMPI